MKVITGKIAKPRRILLYGQHGVGKSTWASEAPSPIFLDMEGGLNDIDCARTDHLKTIEDVFGSISWIITEGKEYRTIVIDTLDWLEKLVLENIARQLNKPSFSQIQFGQGHGPAVKEWGRLLDHLETARSYGKGIILLSHARIVRFENPETQAYDRYEPDLHKLFNGMTQEWCDEVLFASFRIFTRTEDSGFGKERTIVAGGKERFIRTNESAAAVAKNRLRGMPDELPMSWSSYIQVVASQGYQKPRLDVAPSPESPAIVESSNSSGADISGLVVDGSSKVAAA